MADHFVSLNRGEQGFAQADFTTGAASTAGDDIELRIADAASLTKLDVIQALDSLKRYYESGQPDFPVL